MEDLETKSAREIFQDGLEVREVRESAARDIGEALSRLDGVWKLRKGAIANDVVLRGFSGGNLNVLIDGVRIHGACPNRMDPAAFHVDFAEVERVELSRGAYDTANLGSLGGSVNILRKRPSPGFRLTPWLQWGSFGAVNPSLVAAGGSEKLDFLAGYSFRRSAPYRDGSGRRMTETGGYRPEFLDDEAYRIHTGWFNLRFSPAQRQSGELSYTRQDGANTLYPYLMMDSPFDIADRLSARYGWRDLPGSVRTVQLHAYYTRVNHWMTDEKRLSSLNARDVFSMATFAHSRTSGARADVTFTGGLTAGFEAFERNWNGVNSFRTPIVVRDQNMIPNVRSRFAGAYLDWNQVFSDRMRLGAGARLDSGATESLGVLNSNLFSAYGVPQAPHRRDTLPSANARLALNLASGAEWFLGAGSSVRFPDAQERYFQLQRMGADWIGNPALPASRNGEITTGLNLRHRGAYVKPLLFYSSLDNFVIVVNRPRVAAAPGVMNPAARSYENVSARLYGGEISYAVPAASRWILSGGASYTRGSKDPIPALGMLDTNLPEIPPLRARSSLRYGTRIWWAEAEGIAAAAQRRVDTGLRETPVPGYFLASLRAGIHAGRYIAAAGIENLFDRRFVEYLSFQRDPFRTGARLPEPGRTLYLNVSYTF